MVLQQLWMIYKQKVDGIGHWYIKLSGGGKKMGFYSYYEKKYCQDENLGKLGDGSHIT